MSLPFRARLFGYLPRWARNTPGSQVWAFMSALGKAIDKAAWLTQVAYEQHFIEKQWDAQLTKTGIWLQTPRYSLDTTETYRARLSSAIDRATLLGTSKGIETECILVGYTVEVRTTKDWLIEPWNQPEYTWNQPNSPWNTGPGCPVEEQDWWNRFWLVVYINEHIVSFNWDQPEKIWNQPDSIWNKFPVTKQELDTLKEIALRWRACYNQFYAIIFVSTLDGSNCTGPLNKEERA